MHALKSNWNAYFSLPQLFSNYYKINSREYKTEEGKYDYIIETGAFSGVKTFFFFWYTIALLSV